MDLQLKYYVKRNRVQRWAVVEGTSKFCHSRIPEIRVRQSSHRAENSNRR